MQKSWHKCRALSYNNDACYDSNSFFYVKEQSKLSLTICYFLYFQIEMALKKAESQMLAKRLVTFFKNESKEVLKHTVNHF